ncbi:MAG: biotin carboxylase N-terminal domain-containing protein, partial [Solirubrobacteraceae bacterium]
MIQREFSRLAIADRGEPAMRVVHAVRELNHGRADPVHLIALHTEAERDALFVRLADEAVYLDPGPTFLERALRAARADAAWG